ncbi:ribonuclease H protein [Trifolium medium]|uniref:Ribonuclease H protein n=1 Tax=Trifolium medium TaxID=97028 RepID=A0A392N0W1_9FABA|nr:ribonuclease H protein [Trifolium medium]
MAWEFGITELWCYSDSKVAIKLISEPVNAWHHYATILYNIKEYLARDWRIHIVHTFREGNACADYLAKFGAANPEAYSPIVDPPDGMSLLLLADASGTFFSR